MAIRNRLKLLLGFQVEVGSVHGVGRFKVSPTLDQLTLRY